MSTRTYVRNMGSMVFLSTAQRFLGMLTTVILARLLGSAAFGTYSIVTNTATSAYGLARLGIDAAIHVHTATHDPHPSARREKGQLLGTGLLLLTLAGVAAGAACLLLGPWLATTVYAAPRLTPWIRWAGLLVLIQCLMQFCYAMLVGLHQFGPYSRLMLTMALIGTPVSAVGAALGGLGGAVGGFCVAQAITLAAVAWLSRRSLRAEHIRLDLRIRWPAIGKIVRTGGPFYMAGLLNIPVVYYLQGLLVKSHGTDALGGLRVILAITALVTYLPTAVAAVMISHLTREATANADGYGGVLSSNLRIVWFFAQGASGVVMIVFPPLLGVMFGEKYTRFVPAGYLAVSGTVFSVMLGTVGNAAFSKNAVGLIFFYTCVQTLVFLLLAAMLIPAFALAGYLLAENASFACALLTAWGMTSRWRRAHGFRWRWAYGMMAGSGVLLGAALLNALLLHGLARYATAFLASFFVLVTGHRLALTDHERAAIMTRIGRLKLPLLGKKQRQASIDP